MKLLPVVIHNRASPPRVLPGGRPTLAANPGRSRLSSRFWSGSAALVEVIEPLTEAEGSRVIVTWVQSSPVDLHDRGIDENQAADLRRRLTAFTEDWERPEMAAYDETAAAVTSSCSFGDMAGSDRALRLTLAL